jgi:benzoyl-CoA-dihydrodiol lyase
VLPGTGGLTRVVDKRKVRRDLADDFSTLTEGVRGKRAVEGRFVDAVYPTSKFQESVAKRAQALAAQSDRRERPGITLGPLSPAIDGDTIQYKYVKGRSIARSGRASSRSPRPIRRSRNRRRVS